MRPTRFAAARMVAAIAAPRARTEWPWPTVDCVDDPGRRPRQALPQGETECHRRHQLRSRRGRVLRALGAKWRGQDHDDLDPDDDPCADERTSDDPRP